MYKTHANAVAPSARSFLAIGILLFTAMFTIAWSVAYCSSTEGPCRRRLGPKTVRTPQELIKLSKSKTGLKKLEMGELLKLKYMKAPEDLARDLEKAKARIQKVINEKLMTKASGKITERGKRLDRAETQSQNLMIQAEGFASSGKAL